MNESAEFERYAVYYTPPPGALATFGAGWLGWDLTEGRAVAQPDLPDLDMAAVSETPRCYGFHATIKPPFRLADGRSEAALNVALRDLCATLAPIRAAGLELNALGRFLALTWSGDDTQLRDLAAEVVQKIDVFRAPQTAADLDRHQRPGLTARQQQNLRDWGYPHVLEDFRFHMTLTGRLDKSTLAQARDVLAPRLRSLLEVPLELDSLTLVGQREEGMFVEIERFSLTG